MLHKTTIILKKKSQLTFRQSSWRHQAMIVTNIRFKKGKGSMYFNPISLEMGGQL